MTEKLYKLTSIVDCSHQPNKLKATVESYGTLESIVEDIRENVHAGSCEDVSFFPYTATLDVLTEHDAFINENGKKTPAENLHDHFFSIYEDALENDAVKKYIDQHPGNYFISQEYQVLATIFDEPIFGDQVKEQGNLLYTEPLPYTLELVQAYAETAENILNEISENTYTFTVEPVRSGKKNRKRKKAKKNKADK